MQNWIKRLVIALLASVGLGLVLIGCSPSVPEPPEATQHSEETQTEDYSDYYNYDLPWYDVNTDVHELESNIGTTIASAIDAGNFGAIKRYDQQMKEISADYDGWGTISAEDNKIFARVWWDHGVIDYTMPITRAGFFDKDDKRYEMLSADDSLEYWHMAEISRDGRRLEDYRIVHMTSEYYDLLIGEMEHQARNPRP